MKSIVTEEETDMAVPKRKWSKARSRRGRSHYTVKAPVLTTCPQCKALKMPHYVCKQCGYYNGREVVATENA